jgi:SpoIIAA-like
MIEMIDVPGDGTLGFVAKGEVTGSDYETVLVPAIERALAERDKISLLYVLGDDFSGYELAAMWDDTKVGMGHLFSWERIALVTDHDGYRRMAQGFGFLIPAEVRVFPTSEVDEAKSWVGGS